MQLNSSYRRLCARRITLPRVSELAQQSRVGQQGARALLRLALVVGVDLKVLLVLKVHHIKRGLSQYFCSLCW